jgi:hypothetical protein
MLHLLRRHPLPISAFFRHSLVLTYAVPQQVLQPLLPPGLRLDLYGDHGFLAIALVQTEGLRPAFLPRVLGQDFFLSGYRIFARFDMPSGRTLRGLRILRSDTDKRLMVTSGNLLTHYNYRKCDASLREEAGRLEVRIRTQDAEADLDVVADLTSRPAPLPPGSPFPTLVEARKFAGPLPFTFDHEKETNSIVMIEAVRGDWDPQPVQVEVRQNTFLTRPPFAGSAAVLANAFYVNALPYGWKRGVREPLARKAP